MAGNPLSRFAPGSPRYEARIKQIPTEMVPRAEKGRELQILLSMAGIDIGAYQDLLLRYHRGDIDSAIRDFGPEFHSHLPSEEASGLPEQDWTTRWEADQEDRRDEIASRGNGRVESESRG